MYRDGYATGCRVLVPAKRQQTRNRSYAFGDILFIINDAVCFDHVFGNELQFLESRRFFRPRNEMKSFMTLSIGMWQYKWEQAIAKRIAINSTQEHNVCL